MAAEARLRCPWAVAGPGSQKPTWGQRGLAAVPVGGGRAWPGFEIDHSEPKGRVWRSRGRAAAHGHTKQPGRGHGSPTSAATRPTTHARAGPTPHRRFHKLCRASNRAATTHMSSCLPHARLNPGQNSPASMCLHPKRDKTLPARAKQPKFHAFGRAGRILSRTCPEVPRPGTFCPTTSCTLARSPTGSHVHRLLHRWAGATHGASEAWLRCPWAVAGPGRASRSITPSRRLACGDLAGGPPPTGTQSSPAGAAAHATAVNPAAARAHNEAATGFPATASSMNER